MSDPTVLGMIHESVKRIEAKQDVVNTCVTKMKVEQENHKVRLGEVEKDQKKIQADFIHHIENKKKHYNMGFKETFPQKMKRKAPEYTLVGSVITICSAIIIKIVEHFFG